MEATRTQVNLERHCIEVSISSNCHERADSFRARLQYTQGICGQNETILIQTINDTLAIGTYSTCIPISETETICYSAQVFSDGVEVGRTNAQQLTLLSCNTSSLNFKGVMLNSSMGEITPGEEVAHNTVLKLQCDMGCNPATSNKILNIEVRCFNGTLQHAPAANTTLCICTTGKSITCMHEF